MSDEAMIEAFLAVDGVPVDPLLPPNWDQIDNDLRPDSHRRLWGKPYIVTCREPVSESQRERWRKHWPEGVRYDVRCLDGGAWDRSTNHGSFASLAEAVAKAESIAG